jgi:hypothetical protein
VPANRLNRRASKACVLRAVIVAMLGLGLVATEATPQETAATSVAPSLPAAPAQSNAPKPASLNDLAWLQGQWTGSWGPRVATQTWSAPRAGTILGTLQIVEDDKTLVVEFVMISQTDTGLDYRLLHFTPSLAPWEKSGPAVLSLIASDIKRVVFQNESDGEPQQVALTHIDPDTYSNRWEIRPEAGDPQNTEIVFRRQKTSAGSASHR